MLQPCESDSAEHSKHRFMVQSMLAPDYSVENLDLLVSSVTVGNQLNFSESATFSLLPCSFADTDRLGDVASHMQMYTKMKHKLIFVFKNCLFVVASCESVLVLLNVKTCYNRLVFRGCIISPP